jgi:deoxyribodipyrimidine photo-lyase
METIIVWFKTNLRLTDNEALYAACQSNAQVIPVYCFDHSHFTKTRFETKKTGNFRAAFLLESLANLDENLRKLNSGLVILKGKPEDELYKIAESYKATKIYAQQEISHEEQATEKRVKAALQKLNCEFKTFESNCLYLENQLPFGRNELPDVFTHFRKLVEKLTKVEHPLPQPSKINTPKIEQPIFPTLQDLDLTKIEPDNRAALAFKGGETEALARLKHYFEETKAISTYKETRNGLIGANYSSKFSAWLALGCISLKTIYNELKIYEETYGENDSTYWLFFELLWRTYFRLVMKKYGHQLFLKEGIKGSKETYAIPNAQKLEQWKNGQTGVDFIDANMLELKLTGFMSNRGRQNVASYLINDLKQDWRYGAAYFEEQLIDYDVSSNWGNWAYLAGVGNDPRSNRYFNIEKQANDYDKDKQYRNLWLK